MSCAAIAQASDSSSPLVLVTTASRKEPFGEGEKINHAISNTRLSMCRMSMHIVKCLKPLSYRLPCMSAIPTNDKKMIRRRHDPDSHIT